MRYKNSNDIAMNAFRNARKVLKFYMVLEVKQSLIYSYSIYLSFDIIAFGFVTVWHLMIDVLHLYLIRLGGKSYYHIPHITSFLLHRAPAYKFTWVRIKHSMVSSSFCNKRILWSQFWEKKLCKCIFSKLLLVMVANR